MKLKRFPKFSTKSKYFPILIGLLITVILLLFVNTIRFNTYEGFNVPTYISSPLTGTTDFGVIAVDSTKKIITTSGPPNSSKINIITISGKTITMGPHINKNNIPDTQVMSCDSFGNIYVFSNFKIFRIQAYNAPQLYAGSSSNSSPPFGYVNGPALSAKFSNVSAIVSPSSGSTLYICDTGNHCIRMMGINGGPVTTYAGAPPTQSGGSTPGNIDGALTVAKFNNPVGITMDSKGNLFVSDQNNKSIRIISGDQVKTIAKGFNVPQGITVDPLGNVYVLDSGNKDLTMLAAPSYAKTTLISGADKLGSTPTNIVRSPSGQFLVKNGNMLFSIAPGSNVTQPAPPAQAGSNAQPAPPAQGGSNAQPAVFKGSVFSSGFVNSMGITIDSAGNIYATNGSKPGSTLSKISTSGTTAGAITRFGNASFFNLMDIKVDSLQNVYITDAGLQRVYKISTNGNTGIYSGVNVGYANGPALSATFNNPDSMIFDTANNLYVCDTNNHCIRRIAANGGDVTTYAGASPTGAGLPTSGSIDGLSTAARFNQPKGITIDPTGNLYVTDFGNKTVRKITTNGQVSTISSGFNQPNGITIDPASNIYVVDSGNRSVSMLAFPSYNKSIISVATGTSGWTLPVKIARSSAGTLYVTDAGQNNIWKV